ncbi:MAG: hypothetical protein CL912_23540 [Deltaproteobacteria bacterium]|nr:hypothetical protein [Deltaproteobacteria bacterium]
MIKAHALRHNIQLQIDDHNRFTNTMILMHITWLAQERILTGNETGIRYLQDVNDPMIHRIYRDKMTYECRYMS